KKSTGSIKNLHPERKPKAGTPVVAHQPRSPTTRLHQIQMQGRGRSTMLTVLGSSSSSSGVVAGGEVGGSSSSHHHASQHL
ncbi:unnamed protein product, partial [Amoebophrya sp. A25]